jgi:hypothetical protein
MRITEALFNLPLLTKELVERAARRRTYWLRVLFALALYFFFWSDNRYRLRAAGGSPAGIARDRWELVRVPYDAPFLRDLYLCAGHDVRSH